MIRTIANILLKPVIHIATSRGAIANIIKGGLDAVGLPILHEPVRSASKKLGLNADNVAIAKLAWGQVNLWRLGALLVMMYFVATGKLTVEQILSLSESLSKIAESLAVFMP